MLLNPWRKVTSLQRELDRCTRYISQLRRHQLIETHQVLQRELSFAHAALRRKNKQLKYLKATVEVHKEYVRLHTPKT